jgi:hypothetical protein
MNISKLIFILTLFIGISACVKTEFDEPPYNDNDPKLNANFSIKDLKKLHKSGKYETVNDDYIIKAVVIADDKSGNYYKTIVVQDSTGGMEVKINGTGLFATYPAGRRVYIKTKGMTLGDYNGNFQVGMGTYLNNNNPDDERLSGIRPEIMETVLLPGSLNQPLVPKKGPISSFTSADYNTLVELDSVEFNKTELGKNFSDGVNSGTNRIIEECEGNTILLRSSLYADFAGDSVPSGRGNIVAVLSVFGSDKQLYLRDKADINFGGDRCGQGGGGTTLVTIQSIRDLYSGGASTAGKDKKIKGIVISDATGNNLDSKNAVVYQPGSAGILVRFDAAHSFKMGDEIEVDVSNQELSEFNGLLQLNNVPLANASLLSSGNSVVPQTVTIKDLNTNFESYESELVKVTNVSWSKSDGTFNGSVDISDGTGSFILYTRAQATFASSTIPAGTISVTGYITQGGSQQTEEIAIRNPADIGQ